MLAAKGKISTRQAVILFFMMTLSPAIRLFPGLAAREAGKAGWLAPVAAVIPMILLILLVHSFFKENKEASLSDIYNKVIGKVAGKILCFLYLIWVLILLALYVRYYAERLLSSIMPHTSISFFIISMLILVFFAVRSGLIPLARVNEVFFGIFLIMMLITFVLASPGIKYRNFMNVSYLDTLPVIKASHTITAIWGYFLFIFFFGDKINDKENIKRFGFQGVLAAFVVATLILITTIGTIGPNLMPRISLPFFMVVKNISIFETLERLESIIISLWVISDFVTISVFTYISISLIKSIFNLSETKTLVGPVTLFAYIGSLYFFKDIFQLEAFSSNIALPVNTTLTFIIQIIIFAVGKLRKKI